MCLTYKYSTVSNNKERVMAERNRKEEGVQSSDDDEPSHEIAMANLSLAKDASS